MARARALIVDDHSVFRQGLRALLEDSFDVVGEAREGGEAVEKAMLLRPDVVVLDINMPGMHGIEAARQIKRSLPKTGIVTVSVSDDDEQVFAAIQAGVSAYVVKNDLPEHILEAVRHAADGKAYLPAGIAQRVLAGVAQHMTTGTGIGTGDAALTSRELAVLRLIGLGKRNREIAEDLFISERTVGNHITSIYGKLQIGDRAQAISYAIRKGLIRI